MRRSRKKALDFDLTTPCPLCGYKIPPNELMHVGWSDVRCSRCGGVFDSMAGIQPQSTS